MKLPLILSMLSLPHSQFLSSVDYVCRVAHNWSPLEVCKLRHKELDPGLLDLSMVTINIKRQTRWRSVL
ncbi:hypothetical protein L211DRAFT_843810 [Terfezia boudieri ATCC MYA-4762]|uniref:Secreted protein n=1 Tax=Terfezia boudieri ATCC MYA-4762 TaxID=1051890 RepID=A0A3N4L5T7_9PEZI|nr:hypothetical protein L211DRAFT_843810 [Terfezia boudieri ATCC MYA-4762]